ncbi:MAG: aldose epimerase family protein [Acidobacteriota bacterium]
MRPLTTLAAIAIALCALAEGKNTVNKQEFGKTPDGTPVEIYTLRNKHGLEARIMTYGAIVVGLKAPDRNGKLADIVLGFDSLDGYLAVHPYFGAVVGRYGNRIAKGRFTLDGKEYKLAVNNGENSLHGGIKGFDKAVWKVKQANAQSLELGYLSRDGEEGYPGNLDVTVRYTLNDDNELKIEYSATTDKPTVLNLTNHSYFNLKGEGQGDILEHQVTINADRFTPVDGGLIPTGELRSVEGTPLDFRKPTAVGARIESSYEQMKLGGGYDHNFVLNRAGSGMSLAGTVYEAGSGRVLQVYTDQPGVQFYTGNFLDGTLKGKGGHVYPKRAALCLETQHYPDSPNHPDFPTTTLRPGERYQTTTVWKFSAR